MKEVDIDLDQIKEWIGVINANLDRIVKNKETEGFIKSEGELKVKLDTKLTPELQDEAKARELIRKIQGERKKLGMNLAQEIVVTNTWLPKSKEIAQKIKNKTLATALKEGKFSVTKAS